MITTQDDLEQQLQEAQQLIAEQKQKMSDVPVVEHDNTALQSEIETLRHELASRTERVSSLEQELATLRTSTDTDELVKLKTKLAKALEGREKAKEVARALGEKARQQSDKLGELKEMVASLQKVRRHASERMQHT